MKPGYKTSYSNNWPGNTYKRCRVLNDHDLNKIKIMGWDKDIWRHSDTIGEWKIKKKYNGTRK